MYGDEISAIMIAGSVIAAGYHYCKGNMVNMKAIFGLGNPTREYTATRHNIGFDTVTCISDMLGIPVDVKKHKGLCGFGHIGGEKIMLIQPQTYMNLSGECVRAVMDFYKLEKEDVIIIYDDVALPVGQLRVRARGSAGGHNGIKSIIAHIGGDEFARVRVGVGEKPDGWDLADYVLGRFSKDEEPIIRDALKRAAQACQTIVTDGIESAMNTFNRKQRVEGE